MSAYDVVRNAQVKTFSVARKLTNAHFDVTPGEMVTQPPFCLRIRGEYRTPEMQQFRDQVAMEARRKYRKR